MRRYEAADILTLFVIAAIITVILSGGHRLVLVMSGSAERQRAEADIRILKHMDGTLTESSELTLYFRSIKAALADPELKLRDAKAVFDWIAAVRKIAGSGPEAALIVSTAFKPHLRLVTADDARDQFAGLFMRHGDLLEDALAGRPIDPSKIAVPDEVNFWSASFFAIWWLVASWLIIALYLLIARDDRVHPVSGLDWSAPGTYLVCAALAPSTLPLLSLYGCHGLIVMDHRAAARALARRARSAGYQMRIIRRLPAPVVQPAALSATAPSQVVSAANVPEPAAPAAAPDSSWYVVNRNLVRGLQHRLAEKGIRVYPIAIREPVELQGWAVQSADLATFEDAIALRSDTARNEPTDIEGTFRRTYTRRQGEILWDTRGSDSRGADGDGELRSLLQQVSRQAGGTDITYIESGGAFATVPAAHTGVVILHCLVPTDINVCGGTSRAYGSDLPKRVRLLRSPDRDAGKVIADADGNHLAQVVGKRIYLLVDEGMREPGAEEAFARLLHESVALALIGSDDEDEQARLWRADLDRNREQYAAMSSSRLLRLKGQVEAEIAGCRARVVSAGKAITAAVREERQAEGRLKALVEHDLGVEKERLGREFDQLVASKAVMRVRASPDLVEIWTKTVFIRHQGRRYRIGQFRVVLREDSVVEVHNVANFNKRNGDQHPHVRGAVPCFGNIAEAVAKLMADREYAAVYGLLCRFLESYNRESAYSHVDCWPEEPNV